MVKHAHGARRQQTLSDTLLPMVKHAHGARRQQTRSDTPSNGQACTWRSKATDTRRQAWAAGLPERAKDPSGTMH
eukprot:1190409-Prorocentrum_minimum.AAC.4